MEEFPEIVEIKELGVFKCIHYPKIDCSCGFPIENYIQKLSDPLNPPLILEFYDEVDNVGCTGKGRAWAGYKGNFGGAIAFPESYFEKKMYFETFPIIGSLAVRDVLNKYAPGEYFSKFPNDVVCKKHNGKTSGIMFKKEFGYAICIFGVNLVAYPPEELIRAQGLKACCLKKHTDKIPSFSELAYDCAMKIIELFKIHNTIEKICDFINEGLCEFAPKTWHVEVNNPNADLEKDGVLWNSSSPNALTKGYLNGVPYDGKNTYFDNSIIHRIKDDKNSFSEILQKIKEDKQKKE